MCSPTTNSYSLVSHLQNEESIRELKELYPKLQNDIDVLSVAVRKPILAQLEGPKMFERLTSDNLEKHSK